MSRPRGHPLLYEANARVFLRRLSGERGRPLTLASVPEEEWRELARRFDLLWLMGVWRRSPAAREKALRLPGLRRAYDEVLPGWAEEDVGGSPYAVGAYELDPALGGAGELAALHSKLNRLGLGLLLDFVPNHLALDHPWTRTHPERFVRGSPEALQAHPEWFFPAGPGVFLAHGKDPNFPPWTDTAQVNFFSPEMREALTGELLSLSEVADGVRCDMAMLALNEVFERVWGWALGDSPRPAGEFWDEAIGRVKRRRPDFLFVAEAYWGLEGRLIGLGFDYAYDKTLYDLLRHSTAGAIRTHIASGAFPPGSAVRFIENHDEERAPAAFGRERSRAAAVVAATLPGMRLFHDGQLEGHRLRLPVQLLREPPEPPDGDLARFHDRLLEALRAPAFCEGEWKPLEAGPAWEGNGSCENLLAWSWGRGGEERVVVVNYSASPAQGRIKLGLPSRAAGEVVLRDALTGENYPRDIGEMRTPGLYVDLSPWASHLLEVGPPGA